MNHEAGPRSRTLLGRHARKRNILLYLQQITVKCGTRKVGKMRIGDSVGMVDVQHALYVVLVKKGHIARIA
jgi:hypothetical protein